MSETNPATAGIPVPVKHGHNFKNLTGRVFERLTVVGEGPPYVSPNGTRRTRWNCVCSCGSGKVVSALATNLLKGTTRSCGCRGSEITASRNRKNARHGHTRRIYSGGSTREYNSWQGMRERCLNPKGKSWEHYGGRGIKICDRWLESFENFLEDMGPRPAPSMSIDRIDVNGNYEPGNCRWETKKRQSRNRRNNTNLTINGETLSAIEWSERSGINYDVIIDRLEAGWEQSKAVFQPVREKRR